MPNFIQVENVSYRYKDDTPALKNVSLSLHYGELVALIGKNGSGKTTLAKILTGMLRPSSGHVFIEGKDYSAYSVAQLGRKIGYVFQNPDYQLFSDTVAKEIAFGLKNIELSEKEIQTRIDETLKLLRLEHYRNAHPRSLSLGQRQGVAIASILAMKPNAVILDEPATGQDYQRRLEIMHFVQQLNREGKLVILISHDISHIVAYCKRVIAMNEGEIIADGATQEILGNRNLLNQISLKLTPMMQLADLLQAYGCPKTVFTVDEMASLIQEQLRKQLK